jgi:oligoendopeptidase F
VSQAYEQTWQTLLSSANRQMFENLLSADTVNDLLEGDAMSDEETRLLTKIQGVTSDYWRAIEADYSVTYQGKTYTFDSLSQITNYDEYTAVYTLLAKARNQAAASVLANIVPTCNAYARLEGYSNYADYAYAELYGRDYTSADSAKLYSVVKSEIVPLYNRVQQILSFNSDFDQQALNSQYDFTSQNVVLDTAASYMSEISDEYADMLTYMRTKNLVDIGLDAAKLGVSFTSYIPYYGLALIFSGAQNGTAEDFSTFLHEFGHFAYYMYMQEDISHDVNEFFSQGMEVLFLNFADDIFGESGDTYRLNILGQMLQTIIEGCLYDEFQVKVYQLSNPTVHDINVLFHDISEEYGYVYMHDEDEAYNWVTTPHTFIQPFYYISYATSALSAAELLVRSDEDFDKAADKYLSMVSSHDEYTYKAFFKEAGFTDVFSTAGLQKITSGLKDYLYNEICDISDTQSLKGHWAENVLLTSAALGLLKGDDDGNLRPNATTTRAEAFTILWRGYGSEGGEAYGFTDVAANAWYAKAANWAGRSGISTGSDGGRFDANSSLTREQLVTILYRLAKSENEGDEPLGQASLSGFPDSDKIADWATEAFAWAVDAKLVQGTEKGLLEPKRAATRAEVMSIICAYFGI